MILHPLSKRCVLGSPARFNLASQKLKKPKDILICIIIRIMNVGKFSLTELKRLVAEGQRRDLMDAKEYIQKYFFPRVLTTG